MEGHDTKASGMNAHMVGDRPTLDEIRKENELRWAKILGNDGIKTT